MVIPNTPFHDLLQNTDLDWFLLLSFLLIFFIRTLINNGIYNYENGTNFSMIKDYIAIPDITDYNEQGGLKHTLLCLFTIWFYQYKPENKLCVMVSNLLSIFVVGIPLLLVAGLFLIDTNI